MITHFFRAAQRFLPEKKSIRTPAEDGKFCHNILNKDVGLLVGAESAIHKTKA
jgi:hypothetical protein